MWRESYVRSLQRAQQQGQVAPDIDVGDAAQALVAQIEGILSLARNSQDSDTLAVGARGLRRYLQWMGTP